MGYLQDMAFVLLYLLVGTLSPTVPVPTVQLNGGVKMPVLALGTAGFDNETAAQAIHTAFSHGLFHVHTAWDYFNTDGVRLGIASQPRQSTFVTSMTSPCIHSASPPVRRVTDPTACYELTRHEINATLMALDTTYLDLLLLHGPSEPFGFEGACDATTCALNLAKWRAYEDFVTTGHIRAIGVSNFCQSCLECLLEADYLTHIRPAVNQLQWHVGMGSDPEGLMSYCAAKGVVVQAYSPLAAGAVVRD